MLSIIFFCVHWIFEYSLVKCLFNFCLFKNGYLLSYKSNILKILFANILFQSGACIFISWLPLLSMNILHLYVQFIIYSFIIISKKRLPKKPSKKHKVINIYFYILFQEFLFYSYIVCDLF